ncbi:MAG: HU family DNA-binding protein [Balneolaceae bacterium]
MDTKMKKEFVQALREIIREEAVQNRPVVIDGLGRFETVHEEQVQKKMKNGDVVMMPPKETLRLVPEKERRS